MVETVKGSAVNERQTLTDVISARSRATGINLTPEALKDPQALKNFQEIQGNLTSALSRLMVVIEKYPDLKSQANFTVLMSQLEGQENRIRLERNRYNDLVKDFNARVRSFPASTIAGMSGFTAHPYFEAAAGAENAPKVNFSNPDGTSTPPASGTPESAPPNPATAPHGPVRPK